MKKQIRILSAVLAAATLTSALALTACKNSSDNEGGTDMTDTRKETVNETQADTPVGMEAEVWSPVEIELQSTVAYENPYVETEIDAVFTHADGTTVTLPGFWKKGKTWAVRFSPTKEGDWSYKVTCKDAANAGLFAEGVIHAAASTKDTAISEHGFVTVESGKRYYQHADGTPFFWLGDTNWQAPTQVSTTICNYPGCDCPSQFHHVVDDRVEKGFTVYQTYFVPEGGNGERGLWLDRAYKNPDTDLFNEKIDGMFEYLHEQGMTIALGLGCHSSTLKVMDLDSFLRFARYVVARYGCYSVVWITGQEITDESDSKTPGYTVFDCYIKAAELVEELDGYKHPNSAHMYPMTADDDRAVRLDTSDWHDSWTIQSGHGYISTRGYYVDFYNYSTNPKGSGQIKPFIEAEVNYEDINCGGFTGYKKNRLSAWTAMLCGSAGFTYGVTGIWFNSFSTSNYTGLLGATSSYSYEPWYMGVDKPGSYEMSYMRQFFVNAGPWYDLIPQFSESRQASFLRREDSLLASTEDASLFVAYFYGESTKIGQLNALDPEKTYEAYWFNPRTGRYIPAGTDIRSDDGRYKIPNKPDQADWAFILTSLGLGEHSEEELPVDLNPTYEQVAPTGSVVSPVDVKAIGGITYKGTPKDSQIMTDNTAWLYDGDPTTVWVPFANQTTQTFLFDLGTPQKLSHIQIHPAEGTILPTFRVEGSNDGKLWTIITDTSFRGVENPGRGSEPLQGAYRFVKVLILNAEGVYVGNENAESIIESLPYKSFYNPMPNHVYPITEISDIVLYAK